MAILVGDVVLINQVIVVDNVNCVISQHYEMEDSGTTLNDLDRMNSLILDNWNPTLIAGVWKLANDFDVVARCLKVMKVLPLKEDDFVYVQNEAGALIGDHLPAHAAAMVTKTAKLTTPGNSGRTFFPGPPSQHFTGGHLNAVGKPLWDNVASFFNDVLSFVLKVMKVLPLKEDDFVYVQNEAGALIGDHLPAHAAAMVTKTAKLTTPGNSGRTFFPSFRVSSFNVVLVVMEILRAYTYPVCGITGSHSALLKPGDETNWSL